MPQVIRAAAERGGGQLRAERGLAGGVPGPAVDRFAEHAAAGAAEQPPVRRRPMIAQVAVQDADQDGRYGDDADRAVGAVLEAACLMRPAGAGPGGAATGQVVTRMIVPVLPCGCLRVARAMWPGGGQAQGMQAPAAGLRRPDTKWDN